MKMIRSIQGFPIVSGNQEIGTMPPKGEFKDWYQYVYGGPVGAWPFRELIEHTFNRNDRPWDYVYPVKENTVIHAPVEYEKSPKQKAEKDPEAFFKYCKKELKLDDPDTYQICEAWIRFTQGKYELRSVEGPIRHCYWMFLHEQKSKKRTEEAIKKWATQIQEKIFLI